MTVQEWLLAREPRPPAALSARLDEALGADADRDAANVAQVMCSASERVIQSLLDGGAMNRTSALDLLAADAFMTYGFEAAAAEPSSVEAQAKAAMVRIAGLLADRT